MHACLFGWKSVLTATELATRTHACSVQAALSGTAALACCARSRGVSPPGALEGRPDHSSSLPVLLYRSYLMPTAKAPTGHLHAMRVPRLDHPMHATLGYAPLACSVVGTVVTG